MISEEDRPLKGRRRWARVLWLGSFVGRCLGLLRSETRSSRLDRGPWITCWPASLSAVGTRPVRMCAFPRYRQDRSSTPQTL